MNNFYPTNITNSQWSTIIAILGDKRKRKHSLRGIDAICLKQAVNGARVTTWTYCLSERH